jgi:thymidylate synthase
MKVYLTALQQVLNEGQHTNDQTGVDTLSLFGMQQRYNLSKLFPTVTTKNLAWRYK